MSTSIKNPIVSVYDENPERYDVGMRNSTTHQDCFELHAKYLQDKNVRILDLACGTGLASVPYYEDFSQKNLRCSMYGVDGGVRLMKIAEKKNIFASLTPYDLSKKKIKLPFRDNSFDCIISVLFMSFLKDVNPIFNLVSRLLKSGGTFMFTFDRLIPEAPGMFIHNVDNMKKLLEANGLSLLAEKNIKKDVGRGVSHLDIFVVQKV
jgi:predicted TPR repeat methyltransferase